MDKFEHLLVMISVCFTYELLDLFYSLPGPMCGYLIATINHRNVLLIGTPTVTLGLMIIGLTSNHRLFYLAYSLVGKVSANLSRVVFFYGSYSCSWFRAVRTSDVSILVLILTASSDMAVCQCVFGDACWPPSVIVCSVPCILGPSLCLEAAKQVLAAFDVTSIYGFRNRNHQQILYQLPVLHGYCMCFCLGLGVCFTFIPCLVTTSYYFHARRATAVGITACGTGVGTFYFPPLVRYLFDNLAYTEAISCVAGLYLQICVPIMFLRPESSWWVDHVSNVRLNYTLGILSTVAE